MPNVVSRKYFEASNALIGVDIFDDASVNIACTGTITVEEFARLASSVLSEYNTQCGAWQGFPACNDLVDRYRVGGHGGMPRMPILTSVSVLGQDTLVRVVSNVPGNWLGRLMCIIPSRTLRGMFTVPGIVPPLRVLSSVPIVGLR